MTKQAISVTLRPANVLWLRARMKLKGARSVSETLDELIDEARTGQKTSTASRSVEGTVRIMDLTGAEKDLQDLFEASLGRALEPPSVGPRRHKTSRKRNRG